MISPTTASAKWACSVSVEKFSNGKTTTEGSWWRGPHRGQPFAGQLMLRIGVGMPNENADQLTNPVQRVERKSASAS
jgi:hypothetical protein